MVVRARRLVPAVSIWCTLLPHGPEQDSDTHPTLLGECRGGERGCWDVGGRHEAQSAVTSCQKLYLVPGLGPNRCSITYSRCERPAPKHGHRPCMIGGALDKVSMLSTVRERRARRGSPTKLFDLPRRKLPLVARGECLHAACLCKISWVKKPQQDNELYPIYF